MVVSTELPEDAERNFMAAWNDPRSKLHLGTITGLIDFAQVDFAIYRLSLSLSFSISANSSFPCFFFFFLFVGVAVQEGSKMELC